MLRMVHRRTLLGRRNCLSLIHIAAQQYTAVVSMDEIQDDALHLALFAADNGMTTNDPFAARYDETALAAQRETLLAELAAGTVREDTLYLFAEEGRCV